MPDARIKPIQIRFNAQYSKYFDAIYNCQLSNRKSDTGQIETDRPMIRPRDGTTMVGNTLTPAWNVATAYTTGQYVSYQNVIYKATGNHTGSTPPSADWSVVTKGTSKQVFYTDRAGIRRHYKVFDDILYYLSGSTWTSLGAIGTTDVEFANHRVPLNNNGTDSTQYTTTTGSTVAEQVHRAAGDTLGSNNNVGSILLITSGLFKGCYAPIISYDTSGGYYILGGAGLITGTPVGTTYKRYDRIADVLQITRGSANLGELYFDGVTPMTWYTGYTTDSLIKVSALASGQGLKKLVSFNNYCWTFSGSTLFYTGGYPGNPLFYNYTGALTISSNGTIVDIFVYKTRLIIIGTSFIFSITQGLQVDRHVTAFGGVKDGYINSGSDVYILTNAKTLVSLKETIAGVVEVNNNFGKEIENYLLNFNADICFGYDSYRVYMYGSAVQGQEGIMCVLDTTYDFWFIYDNLRPTSIISDGGITYLSDRHTDIIRRFNGTVDTDVTIGTDNSEVFSQSMLIKEIDYGDVFSQKLMEYIEFSCENFTQKFSVEVYTALNHKNGKKKTQTVSCDEILIGGGSLGEGNLGENTFGQAGMLNIISVPRLKKITYDADSANLFKVLITGVEGRYFYLSQMDIGMGFDGDPKAYFDPANTQ